MSLASLATDRPRSLSRQLIERHARQIGRRTQRRHDQLREVFAVSFLPGNRTISFLGRPRQQPLGTAPLVCLSYGREEANGRRTMPIRGLQAAAHADGFVVYGDEGRGLFLHDAAMRPSAKSIHRPLNPARNYILSVLGLQMDRACERGLTRLSRLGSVPQLPQIWLGFSVNDPPEFEDSPALRDLAARELGISAEQLGSHGELLLVQYLRDVWARQLLHPADPLNETGALLANAEFCTQARKALRIYEDFSELLGIATWNPAREVSPLELPNPAERILRQFQIHDLNQVISDAQLADLERAMRHAIGPALALTQEEIFDAIAKQDVPVRVWSPVLSQLRSLLTAEVSQCTTDDDLLSAAKNPDEPLIASGACRIQVLKRHSVCDQVAFSFPPDDLGRHIAANLHVTTWRAAALARNCATS